MKTAMMITPTCQNKISAQTLILQLFLSRVKIRVINKIAEVLRLKLVKVKDLISFGCSQLKKRIPDFEDAEILSIINSLKNFDLALNEEKKISQINAKIITILDEDYPSRLKTIYLAPPVLFVKGNTKLNKQWALAVVGARKGSKYGLSSLQQILPEVISTDCMIVSGGAIGIDTMAHEITLSQNGICVVVFGCGLDYCYPEANKKLFEKIVENNGSLISIFPLGTAPEKKNFPIRNRVIAGLAEGTLVVQAAKKSGSLITAQIALNENREVFAIPGPINCELSQGCNLLIKQGATLTQSAQDILDHFSLRTDFVISKPIKNNALIYQVEEKEEASPLMRCLETPKSSEELALELNINEEELIEQLFELSFEGKIVQNFNGSWQKI